MCAFFIYLIKILLNYSNEFWLRENCGSCGTGRDWTFAGRDGTEPLREWDGTEPLRDGTGLNLCGSGTGWESKFSKFGALNPTHLLNHSYLHSVFPNFSLHGGGVEFRYSNSVIFIFCKNIEIHANINI